MIERIDAKEMNPDEFCKLILNGDDWLIERILYYARETDFTMYTSTLKEAWRMSIVGLSRSLVGALNDAGHIPELSPNEDYKDDPMSVFGVIEAKKHRERGIDPAMFIGLFKYYKQTYRDLAEDSDFPPDYKKRCLNNVERFFDRVEIAFLQSWISQKGEDAHEELQNKNRRLTNEKNKYLTIFESISDPIILLDIDGKIDNLNMAAAGLLSMPTEPGRVYYNEPGPGDTFAQTDDNSPRRVKGKHIKDIFPLVAEIVEGFASRTKTEKTIELKIRGADRTAIFEVRLSKMLDVSNKFTGIVVTFIDITDHSRIEEMLKSSQKQLEDRVRQRTLELIAANKELEEEVRERKLAEDALKLVVKGTYFTEGESFFHSLSRNIANALDIPIVLVAELLSEEKNRCRTLSIWNGGRHEDNFEFEITNMPCEKVYLTKDMVHYSRDIKSIFPDSEYSALISAEGYLSYPLFNSGGEIIGHLSLVDNKPINQRKHLNSILKILAMRAGSELERKKTESERKILQKRLTHAEKLSFVGTFISGVAHELNNPLGVVLGFSQRLQKNKGLPSQILSDLKIIADESKRSAEIVKNLLEVSRNQKLPKENIFMANPLRKALDMHYYHFKESGIKVDLDLPDDIPMVLGNATQMEQVFVNIILNAYQAMKKDDTRGNFFKCAISASGGQVITTFFNSGSTIADDSVNKIFNPYFSSKDMGEGTGLGLFVSHKIVEDHGGKMWVEIINNQGVKFFVSLPVSSRVHEQSHNPNIGNLIKLGMKALVIDDEKNILEWFRRTLSDVKISVMTAENGEIAVDLIKANEYDIIFSDIKMPKMDGFELVAWLKTNKPQHLNKLVITTGVIDDSIIDYCKAYDCECLVKPFVEQKVFETISAVTNRGSSAGA